MKKELFFAELFNQIGQAMKGENRERSQYSKETRVFIQLVEGDHAEREATFHQAALDYAYRVEQAEDDEDRQEAEAEFREAFEAYLANLHE